MSQENHQFQVNLHRNTKSEKPAYFVDLIHLATGIKIVGAVAWNGDPGIYKLSMPAKQGDKGKYFPMVQMPPALMDAAQADLEAAIAASQQSPRG